MVTHRFLRPFKARYVRVHPKTWRSHISMRVELYGCRLGKTFKRNSADNALKINFTREEFLETNELPSAQHFNVNITSGIWLSSRKRKRTLMATKKNTFESSLFFRKSSLIFFESKLFKLYDVLSKTEL